MECTENENVLVTLKTSRWIKMDTPHYELHELSMLGGSVGG